MAFRRGDKLVHKYNPDMGPGRVEDIAGRRITVVFPKTGAKLVFAADDSALKPIVLQPGQEARLEKSGETVTVKERQDGGLLLADGRLVPELELWPAEIPDDPVERLAAGEVDRAGAFRNRVDGLLLQRERQAGGLGTFLGGRVHLFPHQLDVAERAVASEPVRWILADEVGLGKTVEACLILSRLLRQERADRTLIVAPATLTVQWLGELWRKFHQVFVLLDKKRREDVATDHGPKFNPFEAHPRAVVSLEDLVSVRGLAAAAVEAGIDLLVVDEAHRLEERSNVRAGRANRALGAYDVIRPLSSAATHLLLLTATPLEADTRGFFHLMQLVRPDAYQSEEEFVGSLAEGKPLPPCTSATRRIDIGGLPPRVPIAIDLPEEPPRIGLVADDARVSWLVAQADLYRRGGPEEGKTLVFVHERESLNELKQRLESATRRRVAIFHEELSPDRCDLEVAEFRRPDGPLFMISTESGGEGRNFEFCRRLVLFDMPGDPAAVEQRIGRLDRISRKVPVEIVYFRPPSGFGADLVRLYEEIGVFTSPLGGLERSLARVAEAIERAERGIRLNESRSSDRVAGDLAEAISAVPQVPHYDSAGDLAEAISAVPQVPHYDSAGDLAEAIPAVPQVPHYDLDGLVHEVKGAAAQMHSAVYHHLHAGGYRPEKASGILERIPSGLDAAMERFVLDACDLFGFETIEKKGRTWYVEFGSDAIVEHLPGVTGGSRWLGTFQRETAVEREELEFYASGHPLVEGLFQELEDGPRGRNAFVKLEKAGLDAAGLLLAIRGEGNGAGPPGAFELRAVDLDGRPRPRWAALLQEKRALLRGVQPPDWLAGFGGGLAEWGQRCRELAAAAAQGRRVLAVAGFRFLK